MRARLWSIVIVTIGLAILLGATELETVLYFALGALPPLACIWYPDIFHRLGEVLAIAAFDRRGTGLIGESAHIVGWLVLALWCVVAVFKVLWAA